MAGQHYWRRVMTALREALADYLALRRALGYRLARPEKLLNQFLTYLQDVGADTLTVAVALDWARLPAGGDTNWWAHRLSVVRGFATYLHALDPATEVPAADLLPHRPHRATPYLYSDDDITALIAATASLRTPLRRATFTTLIGLLSVTGMRVGEAIALRPSTTSISPPGGCWSCGTPSPAAAAVDLPRPRRPGQHLLVPVGRPGAARRRRPAARTRHAGGRS